jgi:hypothetical protein
MQERINNISKVIKNLEDIKNNDKVSWTTKIYGEWISIAITSDLSDVIANYYAKNKGKTFRETTVDELIAILEADIEEKKLKLDEENVA